MNEYYDRRVVDMRTRLVHVSARAVSRHSELTGCGMDVVRLASEFQARSPETQVTCVLCIAEQVDIGDV